MKPILKLFPLLAIVLCCIGWLAWKPHRKALQEVATLSPDSLQALDSLAYAGVDIDTAGYNAPVQVVLSREEQHNLRAQIETLDNYEQRLKDSLNKLRKSINTTNSRLQGLALQAKWADRLNVRRAVVSTDTSCNCETASVNPRTGHRGGSGGGRQ